MPDNIDQIKEQMFLSFKKNSDAKQFQVHVENYNEIDMFEFQNNFRNELLELMDPYIKQAVEDRSYIIKIQKMFQRMMVKIEDLERIIFQKDELEELDLFGKIFQKINNLDKNRIIDDRALGFKIEQQKNEMRNFITEIEDTKSKQVQLEEQMQNLDRMMNLQTDHNK